MLRFVTAALLTLALAPSAEASALKEPHMHFVPDGDAPEVALTLDACMGPSTCASSAR